MQEKHSGLIIRESDVGENDRIITLLTSDCGIIRAFARGSKKIKGKLFSSTRLFTYGDFVLYSGRDKYIVTEATRNTGFFARTVDIERLALAQYICELCSVTVPQEQPDESGEYLRLVLNTLYALDKTDKPLALIKPSFEFRMMSLLGYCPDVTGCAECGEDKGPMLFYPAEGCVLCNECSFAQLGGLPLDMSALSALRYILTCDTERIFSFSIPEQSLINLENASEKYVVTQLERDFRTLDFYHSL